ncbi:Transcription factor [Aspergillus sp. HF37]|nr:Transcription factor [Aspergillus sp. HF37]
MARPRLPPTPAMSGEFTVSDKPLPAEGSEAFVLPPAALAPAPARDFRPASPTSPDLVAARHNPTTSQTKSSRGGTSTKHRLDDLDLPPPPTRTRKIIQMKPKTPAQPQQAQTKASGSRQAKENNSANNNNNGNGNGNNNNNNNAKGSTKKKQPSNASGRKMARKTAHSLIERRRRSKMNEEFGTLKDMIPACRGQEMHKLAILQASIDYVNYLEQCIHDMKGPGAAGMRRPPPPAPPSPTSDMLNGAPGTAESTYSGSVPGSASVSPNLAPDGQAGETTTTTTSPAFSPRSQIPGAVDFSGILPSPVLGPSRAELGSEHPPGSLYRPWPASVASANTSPAMQPRQDDQGDHEASAALLMLNQDRRGTAESIEERLVGADLEADGRAGQDMPRRTGMSVRDLLIS